MTVPVYIGAAIFVLVVTFVVFRVAVRRDYLRSGRLTVLSTFLEYVAICAWVIFGYLNRPPDWPAVHVGATQEIVGWVLFVGGWILTLTGILRLGLGRSHGLKVNALRQTGLYRFSRNPQAVAFFVAILGYLILWPTWRNAGVLVLVAVLLHLMILSEEDHLRDVFGEEYERYCKRVARYVRLKGQSR